MLPWRSQELGTHTPMDAMGGEGGEGGVWTAPAHTGGGERATRSLEGVGGGALSAPLYKFAHQPKKPLLGGG